MTNRHRPDTSDKDFEFKALAHASNYRRALVQQFSPWLRGDLLEVGAGIGQITELLVPLRGVTRVTAVEPDPDFCSQLRQNVPSCDLVQGTAAGLPQDRHFDAIISINVLEHIQDDLEELTTWRGLLNPRDGSLCLFVPARPEIYSPMDKRFGHWRRYTRVELRGKLQRAGFVIVRLNYFNSLGYFAWWANFCLLRKETFEPGKVRVFDRFLFPLVYAFESRVMRPPFGQSLMAIARPNRD